ncbi:MAG TPA: glycosyltransferase family 1 protein, partial [Actinotalea sp.]|nr:glycosyltransferase family 1 protein [Actinotalea sp.]
GGGPLTATREDYYHHLARTTAFLATAVEESYGLEYVEAMVAGAVGVFPDRPWARALLPDGYPFFYTNQPQAEDLLHRAVTDTAACRGELDKVAGGSFVSWLRERHDDSQFEKVIVDQVTEWFGRI